MNASLIAARLDAACDSLAWVRPALRSGVPPEYPAAYVLIMSESADANPLIGVHSQIVTTRFAVEVMVANSASPATGGEAQASLEAVRDEIKAALLGWQPAPEAEPISFAGGQLIEFAGNLVIWRDTFTTKEEFRQ